MRRREFIAFGSALAIARPAPLGAQQSNAIRRVGALFGTGKDPAQQALLSAFQQTLYGSGWVEGSSIQILDRWSDGDPDRVRALAAELLSLKPDVIFTSGIRALNEQRRQDPSVPIVFIATTDPVGQGFAKSLSKPEGNTTGFLLFEFSVLGKLLESFKEVAPRLERVALFINPANRSTALHAQSFQAAARTIGLSPTVISVQHQSEIEPALASYAAASQAGVILPPDVFMLVHKELIARTAIQNRLLLISAQREFVDVGGLMSYGVEETALFRQAAGYVDRILRGTPPSVLPIQAPSSFQLVANAKTALTLEVQFPSSVLAQAAEVIE